MTQPGGAATHYGVLYQALSTIDAALSISIRGDAEDPDTIMLTVEPRGGGGDAIADTQKSRRVMQFKARADERPWSLKGLIDDVLRDLYRAIPTDLHSHSEYLLVTEGAEGRIAEARAFFRELTQQAIPEKPLDVLDDTHRIPYYPNLASVTRRQFFRDVAKRVSDDEEPSDQTYRRLWSLLSRFNIRKQKFDDVAERVEKRLLGYVDASEQVRGKARELYGILLEFASSGERRFTLKELLRRADLPTTSLADLPATHDVAAERLASNLKRIAIDPSKAVRRPTLLTSTDSLFCLAGESGSGKTTLAAQMATDCASTEVVVFISTREGIEEALQRASDEVWKRVLKHDAQIDWESLVERGKLVGLSDQGPWLTIFLDITAGVAESQRLLRLEWSEWNVRVLFTAEEAVGKDIVQGTEFAQRCKVQTLGELTGAETYELLKKRGRSIANVPADVAVMLRRPILADIYCRVTRETDWKPANEYELFDAFWNDAQRGRDGTRHVQDLGILQQLGEVLLAGEGLYPWPQHALHQMSISEDSQERLAQRGWLRILETTDVEFAHERFANWALARAIFQRTREGRWTVDELTNWIAEAYRASRTAGTIYFGYVPMDILWLLATKTDNTELVTAILESLEGDYNQNRTLYEDLLPSIGPAIIPSLHHQMRKESCEWAKRQTISHSIATIAEHDAVPEAVVLRLLNDDNEDIHDAGLAVARTQPQSGSLDRLWRLQREAQSTQARDTQSHWRQDRVLRALVAAVRSNPDWLRRATETTASLEELRTLAWLISILADDRGAKLWLDLKPVFIRCFGSEGARGALQCIDRYNDLDEVDRLVEWISAGTNFVPAEALAALASIDPDRAHRIVDTDALDRVETLAAFWLTPLLLREPELTRASIARRFKKSAFSSASLRWEFRGEQQLDTLLIEAVVERLVQLINAHLAAPLPERPPVEVDHLLALLGAVNSTGGLRTLRALENSPFTSQLVAVASRYTPHGSNTLERFFVRHIQQVLLRIGGVALSSFVELQLQRPSEWSTADIRSAVTVASADVRQSLIAIAEKAPSKDEEKIRSCDALHAIASLDERDTVLRLLESSQHLWIDDELRALLAQTPPIDDDQLSRLFSRAVSTADERHRRLNLLSLSGRSDAVERLIEEFAEETNDDVKSTAFKTLWWLADATTSIDAVLRIGSRAEPEEIAHLLCAIGTQEALDAVERHILNVQVASMSDDLAAIAARLVTKSQKHALAPSIWRFLNRPNRHWLRTSTTPLYDAIGYVAAPDVLDFLHEQAFGPYSDDRTGAILGLSHNRRDAAFDAASAALASSETGRGAYADLLVQIDPSRSVDVLAAQLTRERVGLERAYICRALRQLRHDEDARKQVSRLMSSTDPFERAAGCQAAGWFDSFQHQDLKALALRARDPMVRSYAIGAVRMHDHLERIGALLADFANATETHAWTVLQAVLDSGSPLLLSYPQDCLWLGHFWPGKPRAMVVYASDRLKKRLKEVEGDTGDALEEFYR